jgi:hypothetical protein
MPRGNSVGRNIFSTIWRATRTISNRPISMEDGKVTFRQKIYAHGGKQRKMTLAAEKFILRFLLRVLPKGLVRIRDYRWILNRCRVTASSSQNSTSYPGGSPEYAITTVPSVPAASPSIGSLTAPSGSNQTHSATAQHDASTITAASGKWLRCGAIGNLPTRSSRPDWTNSQQCSAS